MILSHPTVQVYAPKGFLLVVPVDEDAAFRFQQFFIKAGGLLELGGEESGLLLEG